MAHVNSLLATLLRKTFSLLLHFFYSFFTLCRYNALVFILRDTFLPLSSLATNFVSEDHAFMQLASHIRVDFVAVMH